MGIRYSLTLYLLILVDVVITPQDGIRCSPFSITNRSVFVVIALRMGIRYSDEHMNARKKLL